jgi:2-dehydropantoate 2-reductase
VLFLTVQAPDVAAAAGDLAPLARTRIVVTWQNGIRAEEEAARSCPRILGGIVRFTCTMLGPGEVRLRAPGALIVGPAPGAGAGDATPVVEDLAAAGFTSALSPDIRAEKALKLLVNLVSGPTVLLSRAGPEPVLARVQAALLEEAIRVYEAAGIRAEPLSGLGQTAAHLLAEFRSGGTAPDTKGGIYNSTWQNLHHRRPRLENRYYHGEIIRLGEDHRVPTPVNERALAVLEEVHRQGLGPEPFDVAGFRARFEDVIDFGEPIAPASGAAGTPPEV